MSPAARRRAANAILVAMEILTARHAANLLGPLLPAGETEGIAIAYLGEGQLVLGIKRSDGNADAADLPIRQIISEALAFGAAGLVVAHNHPSGDPTPSAADLIATRRLADTAAAVGLRLHDHLIFAQTECRSLRALGLL